MRNILVTGANRGIGLALVEVYAADPENKIIAACRKPLEATELSALAARFGNVTVETLDIADPENRKSFAERFSSAPLDVFIQNAAVLSGLADPPPASREDITQGLGSLDEKGWLEVLRVNTVAPIMLAEALLSSLRLGKERKIAFVSSRWGSIGDVDDAGHIAYKSSKAALNMAMRVLALALQGEKFTVVSLNPGWVRTRMGGEEATLSPQESATRLKQIMDKTKPEQSGSFLSHDGAVLPW